MTIIETTPKIGQTLGGYEHHGKVYDVIARPDTPDGYEKVEVIWENGSAPAETFIIQPRSR